MMMMMIWETGTSVCVKRKTTMKLSSLFQCYFHPTVHARCLLGTSNKKVNVLALAFFASIDSIWEIVCRKHDIYIYIFSLSSCLQFMTSVGLDREIVLPVCETARLTHIETTYDNRLI